MEASKAAKITLAGIILYLLPGCATLVNGTKQPIAIEARSPGGGEAVEARCALRNDKGSWQLSAPGTVEVNRSPNDLHVRCQDKDGMPGSAVLVSRASAGFWGNALLTCGVGMPVDYLSGAGFDYPSPISVFIGSAVRIDKRDAAVAASPAANPPVTR